MAIQWGSYSGYARLGVEFVRTSQASTSEVWRMDVYLGLTGWASDNYNALTVTGSFSYSGSITVDSGAVSALKLYSTSKTFPRPIGRTSVGRVSVSLTEFSAGSPTVSASFTVSGQPYQAPALPSGVSVQINPSQSATTSFRQNSTALRPVAGFDIRQQTWPAGSTVLVGQPGAARTSLTTGVLPAGGEYRFLVRQRGAGGTGDWAYTSWVQTTPRAPANVVAERVTGQIQVSWVGLSEYQDSTFEVYRGSTLVASGITGTTYTVTNPGAGSLVYTVKERNLSGVVGPGTDSNPINVLAPPYAPSNLQPNGGYAPAGATLWVRWTHEPSDGSEQTAYTVRYRTSPEGASPSWNEISGTTAQGRALYWSTLGAGAQWVEWQVRTKGEHADWGPYSPVARVDFAPRPTVQITAPTTTIPADSTTVTITAGDTSREYAWHADAYLESGSWSAERSGYGKPPFTWKLTGLPNGDTLYLTATITAEVDSEAAGREFDISYAAPLDPELEPSWISETGAVSLAITNPSGGTVPAVSNRLERRTPGGAWEIVAEGLPLNGAFTDPVPPLDDRVEYRAVSVAATGAAGYGQPVTPTGELLQAHFLNWGANLENSVRIRRNPIWQTTPGLTNQRLVHFAGQTVPTALMGRETNVARQIGGLLIDEGELTARDQFERLYEAALTATLVTLRTTKSGPVSGVISGVSTGHEVWGGVVVSLSHTRAK